MSVPYIIIILLKKNVRNITFFLEFKYIFNFYPTLYKKLLFFISLNIHFILFILSMTLMIYLFRGRSYMYDDKFDTSKQKYRFLKEIVFIYFTLNYWNQNK